jgi:hypothetical protein
MYGLSFQDEVQVLTRGAHTGGRQVLHVVDYAVCTKG